MSASPNFALGMRIAGVANDQAYWCMRGRTDTRPQYVRSIEIVTASAVATTIILVNPTANGTPVEELPAESLLLGGSFPTVSTTLFGRFSVDAVQPTIDKARAYKRWTFPAEIGASVRWDFAEGEFVRNNDADLYIYNAGLVNGADLDINIEFSGS